MSTKSRVESATHVYHVYGRGLDKKAIFDNPKEKYFVLECMRDAQKLFKVEIYAYCIMPNHFHLIIEGELKEIAGFMQTFQGRYGFSYNMFHNRDGHVFQSKYKSKPVLTESYFWNLIRYIHLNPVKAHLSSSPEQFRWSSFSEYLRPSSVKCLLSPKAIQLLQRNFPEIQNFYHFHSVTDYSIYDDIEEEIHMQESDNIQAAALILQKVYGYHSFEEAGKEGKHLEEIINMLYKQFHLKIIKISNLLKVTLYYVKKVLKK